MVLSLKERYKYFKATIEECGSFLLLENNENIEYNLFEEFAVDVVSFLHEDTLKMFLNEGMIDNDIVDKTIQLRKRYLQIQKNPQLFNVEVVKTSKDWKKILKLSDEIRELLYW